jgi:hypothetical protein
MGSFFPSYFHFVTQLKTWSQTTMD